MINQKVKRLAFKAAATGFALAAPAMAKSQNTAQDASALPDAPSAVLLAANDAPRTLLFTPNATADYKVQLSFGDFAAGASSSVMDADSSAATAVRPSPRYKTAPIFKDSPEYEITLFAGKGVHHFVGVHNQAQYACPNSETDTTSDGNGGTYTHTDTISCTYNTAGSGVNNIRNTICISQTYTETYSNPTYGSSYTYPPTTYTDCLPIFKYNESHNYPLGIEYARGNNVAGIVRSVNSFDRPMELGYVGRNFYTQEIGPLQLNVGVRAGFTWGYQQYQTWGGIKVFSNSNTILAPFGAGTASARVRMGQYSVGALKMVAPGFTNTMLTLTYTSRSREGALPTATKWGFHR